MLKKSITFVDFNDEEVTEDHFFHLSKAELVELEMSKEGGLSTWLETVIESNDGKTIMAEFKKIILNSYGKKSLDGRKFIKTEDIRNEFESSEAYSTLFMELVTDANAAAEFVNGVIPKDLAEEASRLAQGKDAPKLEAVKDKPVREVTYAEMLEMSQEDLEKLNESVALGEAKIVR